MTLVARAQPAAPGLLSPGQIRILDLDGSLRATAAVCSQDWEVHGHDLRALGPPARFLCSRTARDRILAQLDPAERSVLTFYGSGDFHHLSLALLSQFHEPVSLVVFDQHPDWDITSPWPCCGTWVNEALAQEFVQKVVVVGAGPPDLHGWHLWRGNVAALRSGKLEVYPWSWATSRAPLGPDQITPSGVFTRKKLTSSMAWSTLKQRGLLAMLHDVVGRLPPGGVYLSVDKDVLLPQDAVTNWEPGEMKLSELCEGLAWLRGAVSLVGADVTGDFALGKPLSLPARFLSHLNHPAAPPPDRQRASGAVNGAANAAIAGALLGGSLAPQQPANNLGVSAMPSHSSVARLS